MKVQICMGKSKDFIFPPHDTTLLYRPLHFYTILFIQYYHVLCVVIVVSAAAQNDSTSGWETKVVDFFKDKLKQKDIHALVK